MINKLELMVTELVTGQVQFPRAEDGGSDSRRHAEEETAEQLWFVTVERETNTAERSHVGSMRNRNMSGL